MIRMKKSIHALSNKNTKICTDLLAKLDALSPPVVALVEVGGDPSELDELVLLQGLGQPDVVEIVEGIDAGLEGVVILLVDQQTVQGLVHRL